MSKRKVKKFIDKKNSITFHLVHRSQKDPLVVDETAPQRVLVAIDETQTAKYNRKSLSSKACKDEQQKYGIFFDDDYNYLQHLKDVDDFSTDWDTEENVEKGTKNSLIDKTSKINLPSSVFESDVKESVGLLNKAAPISGLQLNLDPDVVAALDDDFDFNNPDNELEDNFVELANTKDNKEFSKITCSDIESDSDSKSTSVYCNNRDDIDSLISCPYTLRSQNLKSKYSEYSLSSNVIKRNEQLTILDNKFEKMFATYNENEIGALDYEEITGYIEPSSDMLLQCASNYEKKQDSETDNVIKLMKDQMKIMDQEIFHECHYDQNFEKLVTDTKKKGHSNCESILSTYSNIYNHPKLISEKKLLPEIKVNFKTGIPKYPLTYKNQNQLTTKNLIKCEFMNPSQEKTSLNQNIRSFPIGSIIRSKSENLQEKKERKTAVKIFRKERRKERKINIQFFKEERKRQEKILINEKINIQANRIL